MASMTSVISLLVLLLATYSYSIPVLQQFNRTVSVYPFMNNGTILENVTAIYNGSVHYGQLNNPSGIYWQRLYGNLSGIETTTYGDVAVSPRSADQSSSEETTTYAGVTVAPRSVDGSSSEETTTYGDVTVAPRSVDQSSSEETTTYSGVTMAPRSVGGSSSEETTTYGDVTVAPRSVGGSSSEETTTYAGVTVVPRSVGGSNSEETTTYGDVTVAPRSANASEYSSWAPSGEENVTEFSSTTMESAAAFNERAVPSFGDEQLSLSTPFYGHVQTEMGQNVQPSSSFTKFSQYTGLVPNEQTATAQYVQQGQRTGLSGSLPLSPSQRIVRQFQRNGAQLGQVYVAQPTTQVWTKTGLVPQYVESKQVPVVQVSGQQSGLQILSQGQQLPQYVETYQVPITQLAGQRLKTQTQTQGQRLPQYVETYELPVSQISVQQPKIQTVARSQRLPQYVQTNQVSVGQVSGQQSGSQISSEWQSFPQSVGLTRVQGNVAVSGTSSPQLVTGDMQSVAVNAYPTTTIRGFTGYQTNGTRRF